MLCAKTYLRMHIKNHRSPILNEKQNNFYMYKNAAKKLLRGGIHAIIQMWNIAIYKEGDYDENEN